MEMPKDTSTVAEDTPEDTPTKVCVATPTNVHTEDTVDDDPGLLIVFGDEMDNAFV